MKGELVSNVPVESARKQVFFEQGKLTVSCVEVALSSGVWEFRQVRRLSMVASGVERTASEWALIMQRKKDVNLARWACLTRLRKHEHAFQKKKNSPSVRQTDFVNIRVAGCRHAALLACVKLLVTWGD